MALPLQSAPLRHCLSSPIHRPPISLLLFKNPPSPGSPFSSAAITATKASGRVSCCVNMKTKEELPIARRSANYMPNIWDYNFVKSLGANHAEEKHKELVQRLKQEVKHELERDMPQLAKLEFIDALQRLGLQYHFDMDIKRALQVIYNDPNDTWFADDLHCSALRFRLLRQHGFEVDQDILKSYMDKKDTLTTSTSNEDRVKELLSLYEASFHGLKGEAIIDEAKDFALKHLRLLHNHEGISSCMAKKINHALELPIHWRPNRVEARWFMDIYGEEPNMNSTLLQLAKLDFNLLQSMYHKEMSELARWWVELGIYKMSFFRDRLVETYFWSLIMVHEPEYGDFRVRLSKITSMITLIDDVYDVFGTLEELELLTDFVERWDITSMDKLPLTIRTSFLALYNTTNAIGLEILNEQGFNAIPYIQKMWVNECRACLKEAKWYHKGNNKMTFDEYLRSSIFSNGGPMMLLCCFLMTTNKLTHEALEYVSNVPSIMNSSGMILRLNNDLGTSQDELQRGDNLKAVECYASETSTSRDVAIEHIKNVIQETWKTLNKQQFDDQPFPGMKPFIGACMNLARASHNFYKNGDGHGIPNHEIKDNIVSIVIQPISVDEIMY